MNDYTDGEFLICRTARVIENNSTIFVGFGLPQVSAMLAEMLYAPNMIQLFEFGAVGPQSMMPYLRGTMGGPSNCYRSIKWCSMTEAFSYAAAGYIDIGILGAAQIDRYGNINSTMLGNDYELPDSRFPGSGGGSEVASYCWKTVIALKHEKRRFVEKLSFLTSPGYLSGKRSRESAGLPVGTGPYMVVTSEAVFDFETEDKQMRLIAVKKGRTANDVIENMEFIPLIADNVKIIEEPTDKELHTLRDLIDPYGMVSKGKK